MQWDSSYVDVAGHTRSLRLLTREYVDICVDPARFFAFFLNDVLASARGADSGACRRQVCGALLVRGLGGLRAVGVCGGFFAAESPCGALVVVRGADVSILIGRDCTVPGVNVAPGAGLGPRWWSLPARSSLGGVAGAI
jgi:hypothetical protein